MRTRETLVRAGLLAASLLLSLAVAEAVLRLLGVAPERYPGLAQIVDRGWTGLLDCYPTNPRGYFDIDLRARSARERYLNLAPRRYDAVVARAPWAVESRYNALRFRDEELVSRPPGVQRVLIVGDSFAEGQGVKHADTCARVLDGLLRAEGKRIEVRNCARRGKDFPELRAAFDDALPFGADVVVYMMVLNDAVRPPEFQARQSYVNDWILERGRMEFRDSAQARPFWAASRLASLLVDFWESRRIDAESTRWYREMYTSANADGWRQTQALIRDMDARTRARGGRFLLALWPLLVDLGGGYPFEEPHATIRRFSEGAGIPFLDLRPALATVPLDSLWVHPLDRHPNEVAHRLAAEILAPLVGQLLSEKRDKP